MKANNDCVVAAVFADYANVRTRGVVKLIFEVPEHEATEAFRRLGGMPQSKSSKWCAIGLLDPVLFEDKKEKTAAVEAGPPTPPAPVEKERRPFHTLPRSQQAGILCGTPEFRTWLAREMRATPNDEAEWVASEVRAICGVSSRTGLDHNEVAACNWDALRNRFHADTGQTTWERPS